METVAPQGGSNSRGEAAAGAWGSPACRNSNPPTHCLQTRHSWEHALGPENRPQPCLGLRLSCHLNLGEAEREGTGWHTHTPKGWGSSFPILGIICTAPKRKKEKSLM